MSNETTPPPSAFQAKMARALMPESNTATATAAAPVAVAPAPAPTPIVREVKQPRREEGEGIITRSFKVDPGKATVAVTMRIPRELHAELRILTVQMKVADSSTAFTMNDFVVEAVREKLRKLRAA